MNKIIFCEYTGSLLDVSFKPTGETQELFYGVKISPHEYIRIGDKDYYVEDVVHDITTGEVLLYACKV